MNRAIKFSFKPSNANLLCVGGHKTQSYDQMSLLLLQVGRLWCAQLLSGGDSGEDKWNRKGVEWNRGGLDEGYTQN